MAFLSFITIAALVIVCAVVLGACTFVYCCAHAICVFFSDVCVYLLPHASRCGSFIKTDLYKFGVRRLAIITTMIMLAWASFFWVRKYHRGLLRTIDELWQHARANAETAKRRDHALADCRTRLEEKTEAAKNVEKRVADARRSNERDRTELRNSRLTIVRLEAQCSNTEHVAKERNKALADVRLLRKELGKTHSASIALKETEAAASSRVRVLEAEIEAFPRWSDSNLAIFTDLRNVNTTLQKEFKALTTRDRESSTRLCDSLAANRELKLHFDAERRAKDWLEIDLGRKHGDVRNAKQRLSTVSAELESAKITLNSANEQLGLTIENVTRLEQNVDKLEREKAELATHGASRQETNASLVTHIAELEALMGIDLLTDAQHPTEVIAQQLEDERQHNVDLRLRVAKAERSASLLQKENVRARKEARISGERHAGAEERLVDAMARLSAAEKRADALQVENKPLVEDNTVLENGLPQMGDEIRVENEDRWKALEGQCEQWAQGVMQEAETAFHVQEEQITALQEELQATKVAMEALRCLNTELEHWFFASPVPAVSPSLPIDPFAFFNGELQFEQAHQPIVGTPYQDLMFPTSMAHAAPQPPVHSTIGQNVVSVGNPLTQGEIAVQQTLQTTQNTAMNGQCSRATEPLEESTTENTHPASPTLGVPAASPPAPQQSERRQARALPRKFAGRVVQALPPINHAPQPAASTSSASGSHMETTQVPVASDPMALPSWW